MKITKGTIIRTTCLVIALVNQTLTMAGHSPLPIEDETVTMVVTDVATVATALIAWWKNNSFSSAAIKADEVLKSTK